MWDFFVYVNTPITSVDDVVMPSWLDSWRYSQLSSYERNFQQGGWSFDAWKEHQKVMLWALGNDVNSALTLRLPGVLTYTRDAILDKFQDYVAGLISMGDLKVTVTQGWKDATTIQGKLNQVQIYRASLGQDPLSEFDMCRLHREEMDNEDNTVCAKYDPKSSDESRTILIAVLIPVLAIIFAGTIIWLYLERKRRHADAIWIFDKEELKFADPPEIAGRGTFGLVVKAEYRGTDVAVKRVIPPKDRINRSGLLLGTFLIRTTIALLSLLMKRRCFAVLRMMIQRQRVELPMSPRLFARAVSTTSPAKVAWITSSILKRMAPAVISRPVSRCCRRKEVSSQLLAPLAATTKRVCTLAQV